MDSLRFIMTHYILLTLAAVFPWTRAELTHHDLRQIQLLRQRCEISCPHIEERVCVVDVLTFMLRIFVNKCFYMGLNKCKNRQFIPLKSMEWCVRYRIYERKQNIKEMNYFRINTS